MSLICFGNAADERLTETRLDGQVVNEIYTDLTAHSDGAAGIDLTAARRLTVNANVAFMATRSTALLMFQATRRASGSVCLRTRTAGPTPKS